MLKTFFRTAPLVATLCFPFAARPQALPTAVARGSLQTGVGWSYGEPDYGQKAIQGVSGWVDFDFTPHLGAEAEMHYIALETPTDLGEISFLIGPRFVYPYKRLSFYAKGLVGIGDIDIQEVADNPEGGDGTYLAYGFGGGVDVRVTRHLVIRAIDAEYQHWSYQTGLTPTAYTTGIAYHFR
jgi:hypothetical protein